ncbi:hypothetical protein N2152v2_006751 [Parachlorella kessleri]
MRAAAKLKRRSWSGVCEISVDTTGDCPRSRAAHQGWADCGGGRRWAPNVRLWPTVIKLVLAVLLLELSRSTLVATGFKGGQDPNLLSRALRAINGDPPGSSVPIANQQLPSPATFSRFAALRRATSVSLSGFVARLRSQHPLRPLRLTVFKGGRGMSLVEQQQQLSSRHRRQGKAVPLYLGRQASGTQASSSSSSSSSGGMRAAAAVAAAGVMGIGGGASIGQLDKHELLKWRSQLLAEEEALLQEEERERQLGHGRAERHIAVAKQREEGGGTGMDALDDCQATGDCGEDVGVEAGDPYGGGEDDYQDDEDDYMEGAREGAAAKGTQAAAGRGVLRRPDDQGGPGSSSGDGGGGGLPAVTAGGAMDNTARRSGAGGGGSAPRRSYAPKRWLSFSVCNGVTSQRIAILSAALLAKETQRVLLVPRLLINGTEVRGQQSDEHNAASCDFSEVMDPRHFAQALATEGVAVEMPALSVPAPSVRLDLSLGDALGQLEAKDQQVHVHVSCPFLRVPPELFMRHEPLVWAALQGMQPSQKLRDAADAVAERFMQVTGQQAFNVLHLRPMTDWEERCGQALFGNQPCPFDLAIAWAQLLEAEVRLGLPLLLVLDRDSIDVAQYKAALASLKSHGYKAFVLKELGGAHLTREQSAMVSYQLGLRTFSALLLMERLHAGKFAAFYNSQSSETMQDFLPLHQARALSDTAMAHAAAKELAYVKA